MALCAMGVMAGEGALCGKFSVSANTQVQFSQGNLQYQVSTKTWRFADNQWDAFDKPLSKNPDWRDVFVWGSSAFVDWGKNAISNGGNSTSVWRTLSCYEWKYLFAERANAQNLFGLGSVNGVKGVILLPDDWHQPAGIPFVASKKKGLPTGDELGEEIPDDVPTFFGDNTYTQAQWAEMETAGAVFLPAAGDNGGMYNMGGGYWSTTPKGKNETYSLQFTTLFLQTDVSYPRNFYNSVRLVKAAGPCEDKPADDGTLSGYFTADDHGTKVRFSRGNLRYNAANRQWSFAANQWDYAGDASDLFVWKKGGWGSEPIVNGGNKAGMWRTLTSEQWAWIIYDRNNAHELVALGTINDVKGTILLPDNWKQPAGITFVPSEEYGLLRDGGKYVNEEPANYEGNTYTREQWAQMEAAGAVFLPAAGYRDSSGVDEVGREGNYWSASPNDDSSAYYVFFDARSLNPLADNTHDTGCSVRLVR